MTHDAMLALLRRMVEIPSLSGHEGPLAAYLAAAMARIGFRSSIDAVGNVVGEIGSGRPVILLLGHLDTVPGDIEVRQEGARLFGRGAVDAKGPLATLICAAAQAHRPAGTTVVVGAVEEETPRSRGAHHLLDGRPPDAVVVGEPSGWADVVVGYKGRVGLIYEVSRPQAHSAVPEEKATEAAIAFWVDLRDYLARLGGGSGLFYRPAAALCRFDGTTDQARLEITCRIPPGFDLDALRAFLGGAERDGTLRFDECTPAVLIDRTAPTVRALVGSIRRQGGRPTLKVKTGTSDMNIVWPRWRVPMAAYGPGDSTLDHTPNEHIDLHEYLRAVGVLADALRALSDMLATAAPREVEDEDGQIASRRLQAIEDRD